MRTHSAGKERLWELILAREEKGGVMGRGRPLHHPHLQSRASVSAMPFKARLYPKGK